MSDAYIFFRAFNETLVQRAANESVFLVTTTSNKDDTEYIRYLQSKCSSVKAIQISNWNKVSARKIELQFRQNWNRPDYAGHISCEANSNNLRTCFEQSASVAWPNCNLTSSIMDESATGPGVFIFASPSHRTTICPMKAEIWESRVLCSTRRLKTIRHIKNKSCFWTRIP